jgi:hypothetical protein
MKLPPLKLYILSFFLFTSALCADVVKLVSNFSIDPARFNPVLVRYGKQATVIGEDMRRYGLGLKKKPMLWEKWFFNPIELEKDVKKFVFFNLDKLLSRDLRSATLSKEKLVLFLWEPPVVLPYMYKEKTLDCFSKIYTWNDDLVDNQKYFKFYYPVLSPMRDAIPSYEEKKFCTFVGTNLTSDEPHSLYIERAKAIAFFEGIGEPGFEFYGRKWNAAQYASYRGPIDDKLEVIKNYRFSLCYENCCDQKGYITEKIFDCFAAGTVPIYWGAPNIDAYIPKDCFIDRRDFSTLLELYTFLKNMKRETYERYIQRIRAFLSSDAAQCFSYTHFEKLFYESIYE